MPAAAQTVGLRWIKLVNPPEGGPDVFPSVAFKVARFWHDDAQASYIAGGYEGGRRWVRDFLPRMRACSWATCHETANEPGCNSNDDLRNLRLYSLGAMREADERGATRDSPFVVYSGRGVDRTVASLRSYQYNDVDTSHGYVY